RAALPRTRLRHAAHLAPVAALCCARRAARPDRVRGLGAIHHPFHRVVVRRQGRRSARGGMNLGQQAIDQMLLDLQAKARAMALEIADVPSAQLVTTLERLRLQAGVREALLLSGRGRLLAAASEDTTKLVPELPAPPLLRQARAQRGHVAIDAQPGKPLSLRAIVPIEPLALAAAEPRFLQL